MICKTTLICHAFKYCFILLNSTFLFPDMDFGKNKRLWSPKYITFTFSYILQQKRHSLPWAALTSLTKQPQYFKWFHWQQERITHSDLWTWGFYEGRNIASVKFPAFTDTIQPWNESAPSFTFRQNNLNAFLAQTDSPTFKSRVNFPVLTPTQQLAI